MVWVYKAYFNKHKSNFIRVVMLINDKCNIKIPDEHKKIMVYINNLPFLLMNIYEPNL